MSRVPNSRRTGKRCTQSCAKDRLRRRAFVRRTTGDRLKEDEGQRVDVTLCSRRFANRLLR